MSKRRRVAGKFSEPLPTAFTDGCSGLRRILADAGISKLPILDWFHIGMRLQHLKQTASGLSADNAARVAAIRHRQTTEASRGRCA